MKAKIRPPRLDGKRMGVLATRTPHRPNAIGMSVVKLDRIDKSTLYFSGIDLIDGTPILDIKPYHPADVVSPSELKVSPHSPSTHAPSSGIQSASSILSFNFLLPLTLTLLSSLLPKYRLELSLIISCNLLSIAVFVLFFYFWAPFLSLCFVYSFMFFYFSWWMGLYNTAKWIRVGRVLSVPLVWCACYFFSFIFFQLI